MTNGNREKIQIYVSSHKPCYEVKNEIFTPARQKDIVAALQSGTEEDRKMAKRANEYCELLTQYWAWKYGDADVYGFCHYRRYFCFNRRAKSNDYGYVPCAYLNAKSEQEMKLADEEVIRERIDRYDVIVTPPANYYFKSVRWQYAHAPHLHAEDLQAIEDILKEDYPEYVRAAEQYLRGHYLYTCNMFIMRRELFYAYSEWLFSILEKFYARRDMHALGYTVESLRTPGHLGERLFGIWYTHLRQQKKYRCGRCRMAVFADTEPPVSIESKSGAQEALILYADGRVPALTAITLASLAKNLTMSSALDVWILYKNLTGSKREKLNTISEGQTGCNVRFADLGRLEGEWQAKEAARENGVDFTVCSDLLPYFHAYARCMFVKSGVVFLRDAREIFSARQEAGSVVFARGNGVKKGAPAAIVAVGISAIQERGDRFRSHLREALADNEIFREVEELPRWACLPDNGRIDEDKRTIAIDFSAGNGSFRRAGKDEKALIAAYAKGTAYAQDISEKGIRQERMGVGARIKNGLFPPNTRRRAVLDKMMRRR